MPCSASSGLGVWSLGFGGLAAVTECHGLSSL